MKPADGALRYERKFASGTLAGPEVEQLLRLNPDGFRVEHPPRHVNSLYLDTPGRAHYLASIDGVGDRIKVRIRWYGELDGASAAQRLEIKAKRGRAGLKRVFPSSRVGAPWPPDGGGLPPEIRELLRGLEPVVVVRYRRSYWRSAGSGLRATVDTGIEYRDAARGRLFDSPLADPLSAVLELKYPVERDAQALRALRDLPLRATRSSKYVRGVQTLMDGSPAPC